MIDLVNMKFYVVVPQAGTNYIYNPRLDKPQGLTGYTVVNGTQALSDTYKRWGVYSIEVTPTASVASSVHYDGVPIATGVAYTFSVYVKGVAGQAMRIVITNSAGTAKQTKQFTASGEWQRVEVTHTGTETASTYECWVTRDSVASTAKFYIDGFQYEQASKASTFIHGDAGDGYSWAGLPRVSASVRSDRTRAGGRLLCINDYAKILQVFGFGMGQFEQIMYPMSNGGDYYQQHLRRSRNVGFLLAYWGDNQGDMQRNRNTILEAVRPDYLDNQPVKIIYQGFDDLGNEATNPLEITCVLQPSHVDTPSLPVFQKDTLMFTVPSGHFDGAYEEGAELELYEEITCYGILEKNGITGQWSNLGLSSNVYPMAYAEAPNGDIIFGGGFTNAGGVAEADYIAKYTPGLGWSSVVPTQFDSSTHGVLGLVYITALLYAPNGDLYIAGVFQNYISADGDEIVKLSGSTVSALGTGFAPNSSVYAEPKGMIIDKDTGNLIVYGGFADAGGVAEADRFVVWNGSSWALIGALNNTVISAVSAPNGDIYLGGLFTNADGTNGDYLCRWDGSAFHMVGDTELISNVNSLAIDKAGNLYVASSQIINSTDYVMKWNGTSWESLGAEVDGYVSRVYIDNKGLLYITGDFESVNGQDTVGVAYYKGGAWHSIGAYSATMKGAVSLFITQNGSLYIIGNSVTGTINCSATHTITNTGNSNVYPKFVVNGPGLLKHIINSRSGKLIEFNGLNIQAGETITINLDPSNLYMTSSWEGRGNVLRYVAAGSDYGNFSLEPGENYINIYMPSGTDSNSGGYMTYTPRFWNIEGAIYE